ncbi:BTAD domain-containing putative transcriptional regulator [Actinosynnema sp. CA-248983]
MNTEFKVLGSLEVWHDGTRVPVPAGRAKVLLATLLLRANEIVSADALVERLWPEGPPNPRRARATLHMVVTRLRQALGAANVVRTATNGYVADVPTDALDLLRFRDLVARDRLDEALALWRGEPLADVLPGDDVAPLVEERLSAMERRMDLELAAGRSGELVEELRALTARHPLREHFWAQLVLALHRSGKPAEALAAYRLVRDLLADRLGVEPGPALSELHDRVLAAGSPTGPKLLPAPSGVFVGREDELAELNSLAKPGDQAVVVAINGTAGVGKTTLAVHWANRAAARFPDGQLYVDLRGFSPGGKPLLPGEAVRAFLEALGVPNDRMPSTADGCAALYRSLMADRKVLVLLDNAHDSEQVRPLLPGAPGCLVLITSRNLLTGLVVREGARPLRVDPLGRDDAVALVREQVGAERSAAEPDAVADLVDRCARLPLALVVVGARATRMPGAPLRAFADELAEDRLGAFDTGDRRTTVSEVFSWSYRYLHPVAARVFRLLSLHPAAEIPAAVAASLAGLPTARTRRVLSELVLAHLVAEPAPGRFEMHDLLRAYAGERAAEEETPDALREAGHRLLDHYLHTAERAEKALYPQREPVDLPPLRPGIAPETFASHDAALAWFRREFRTLLALAGNAADHGFDRHAWPIPQCTATFFHSSGYWRDWVDQCTRGLAIAERLGDPRGRAEMHRGLGRANTLLHHWDEAERHLHAARGLFDEVGDRARAAYTQVNLGGVAELREIPDEGLRRSRLGLDMFRDLGHDAGQARALTAITYMHHELGQYDEAVRQGEAALALYERIVDIPGQAAVTSNVGLAFSAQGRHEEAIAHLETAIELLKRSGDHYYRAMTVKALGTVHRRAGNHPAARTALRKALALFEELGHPDAERVRAELEVIG